MSNRFVELSDGTQLEVMHGDAVVAFQTRNNETPLRRWPFAAGMTPAAARQLAIALIEQAHAADRVEQQRIADEEANG